MGTWGTAISSNDTFSDIYQDFIDLYNNGLSIDEITTKLIDENQETIGIPEDANNFWFAIALGQWECKELDTNILSKVVTIINSGNDLKVWKELEASTADIKAREKVLTKFLSKLHSPKDKPRKRTKKKLFSSIFKKGDCLVYKMDNNKFGGAFVLTDEQNTEVGLNNIAITIIDSDDKPTLEDFKKTEVYVKREKQIRFKNNELYENWCDQAQIGGFDAYSFKKNAIEIEVIGQLPVYKEFKQKDDVHIGYGWTSLKIHIPFKDEYINLNGQATKTVKLSEWTKKHWL